MKQILIIIALSIASLGALSAQSEKEARALYKAGKYAQATPIFEKLIKRSPRNASYNQWYGVCLLQTGKGIAAERYLLFAASRNIKEARYYLAELYFEEYRFEESCKQYEKYLTAGKFTPQEEKRIKDLISQANLCSRMLEGVEDVQIIDSLIVDYNDFFNQYRLSPESGKIYTYNRFFKEEERDKYNDATVFKTQRGEKIIYATPYNGGYKLAQRNRLSDGYWTDEQILPPPILAEGNQNYPFLLADGLTLYFASTGERSLGGYDIFVTRSNLNTGNYLTPENVGMPFNSPYNDYMMAIDEINNIGWFATDRYQNNNKVAIYIFIPNSQKNIIKATPNILGQRARIQSIKQSWIKGKDYKTLLEKVFSQEQETEKETENDFIFIINNNITYHTLSDFDSPQARLHYEEALKMRQEIADQESNLDQLRKKYIQQKGNEKLKSEILAAEKELNKRYNKPEELERASRNAEIMQLRKK